jgi:hypothetical protein
MLHLTKRGGALVLGLLMSLALCVPVAFAHSAQNNAAQIARTPNQLHSVHVVFQSISPQRSQAKPYPGKPLDGLGIDGGSGIEGAAGSDSPICPAGYILSQGTCVSGIHIFVNPLRCPAGYIFDGRECVPHAVVPSKTPPCVSGPQIDCVPPKFPSLSGNGSGPPKETSRFPRIQEYCAPGYISQGGYCHPAPHPCPLGSTSNGYGCFPLGPPHCPAGYTFSGNQCVPPPHRVRTWTCIGALQTHCSQKRYGSGQGRGSSNIHQGVSPSPGPGSIP